jgi:hypothetical protein
MTVPFTGGCLCGAVRYACSTAPLQQGIVTAVIASGQAAVPMCPVFSCRKTLSPLQVKSNTLPCRRRAGTPLAVGSVLPAGLRCLAYRPAYLGSWGSEQAV